MKNKLLLAVSVAQTLLLLCLSACVKDRNFDAPQSSCTTNLVANTTYADVKNLYIDETFQIQEDLVIEGHMISSDVAGNFFSVLHFQDNPVDPNEGFQIEMDLRDSHLFYPVGSKIFIKLKGLYLGKSKDVFKIGGTFTSFGNISVGRLPSAVVDDHIFISCEGSTTIEPKDLKIQDLQEKHTNTLVRFEDVQISEEEIGLPFAREREETERTLTDCSDTEIILLNSGFSDFQSELLPGGSGSITGVLLRDKDEYRLAVRNLEDINFNEERCAESVDEFTSENIFISELADPENNTGARFVELFNSSSDAIPLNGWKLLRYTNDNVEVGSTVDLSNYEISAESALVVAASAEEFNTVFGFIPDVEAGQNSPADSNGDDNFQLVDPFEKVIDAFGIIGEDGSGTNHEFEDGRAVRNPEISVGNATYDFDEWTIFNNSGGSGTIEQPQIAPDDFAPGERD